MKIGIIVGSVREGRLGAAVGQWVQQRSASVDGVEFGVVDVLDYGLPFVVEERLPAMVSSNYAHESTRAFAAQVGQYDAFIFVTPEYNHGIPGPFKNAFDLIHGEWAKKAIAFVGYGASGGIRAVEQWRQVVANMAMYDIRSTVGISIFSDFDQDGTITSVRLAGDLDALFAELVPAATAMNTLRG